ncbi:MAG: metallophosphoesterase [Clostridia bacterium]|nr:metallophosphoesterase [Clostridia bacterium]
MRHFRVAWVWTLVLLLLIGCGGQNAAQPSESASPTYDAEDTIIVSAVKPQETILTATVLTTPPATAEPIAEPTAKPTEEPTPAPQRYVAEEGVYTIAWMSDPQHYSKKFPETYYAMTSFLRDHSDEMHLAYIINTGDLVHNTDLESEWDVADKAQTMIDNIPNGVLAGNHDVLDPIGYKTFCARFGEKRYKDKPWYGGSFENNRGHYDLLTIGETEYLFVYMGFGPTKKAIQWVSDVFKQYPERVGVLCLHDYYTKQLTLSADGKKWHDSVVAKSPNLYMVLCGHKYGAYCFPESFDDDKDGREDRTVYQMLFNYQASLQDGGGGYLRLMQIDEAAGTMHNLTYSPLLEDFNRFDDPNNREDYYPFDEKNEEFTLPLPWMIEH